MNSGELQCGQIAEALRARDQHQRGSRAYIRNNQNVEQRLLDLVDLIQQLTEVLNQHSITGEMYDVCS